jgi:alkylhydroperoxidase family enzyme
VTSRYVGRLPGLTPDTATAEQKAVYDEITRGPRAHRVGALGLGDSDGALLGPFNAMVVAPRIGSHLARLGAAIRYEGALPANCRELAILMCACAEQSAFEWHAHEQIAAAAGVPDVVRTAILAGEPLPLDDPVERAVAGVTASLLETGDVTDGLYQSAAGVLSEVQLVELVVLVGYYRLLSTVLRTFRVPLPAGAQSPFAGAIADAAETG